MHCYTRKTEYEHKSILYNCRTVSMARWQRYCVWQGTDPHTHTHTLTHTIAHSVLTQIDAERQHSHRGVKIQCTSHVSTNRLSNSVLWYRVPVVRRGLCSLRCLQYDFGSSLTYTKLSTRFCTSSALVPLIRYGEDSR